MILGDCWWGLSAAVVLGSTEGGLVTTNLWFWVAVVHLSRHLEGCFAWGWACGWISYFPYSMIWACICGLSLVGLWCEAGIL